MIWHFEPGQQVKARMHTHVELEMNLCVGGRATYLVGQQRVDVTARRLLWLFPQKEHLLIEQTSDFEMWIAVFRPQLVTRISRSSGDEELRSGQSDTPPVRLLKRGCVEFLTKICSELHGEKETATVANPGLEFLLRKARHEYLNASLLDSLGDVHPAVERAAFTIARGEKDTDAETFASQCGLSRARLSRLFKAQMGLELSEFRNQKRMEKFHAYYGGGQRCTVLQAALEAGFGSLAQFYRVQKSMAIRQRPAE
jgi:AraC-like DNA-binding protein